MPILGLTYVHLFSGPRRGSDLHSCVDAGLAGLNILVMSSDVILGNDYDLS